MFAILIHIYYKDSWEMIFREKLKTIGDTECQLLINLSMDIIDKQTLVTNILIDFPKAFIIESPNIGKDIGGKLALIDLLLKLDLRPPLLVLLHDKRSPQAIMGERWRNKLLNIIEPNVISRIQRMFSKDEDLGIVGAKDFIINEYDKNNTSRNNNEILSLLVKRYSLQTDDHHFIGGTMFWVRTEPFLDFFRVFPPLECRKQLEAGNILDVRNGTYTHSWERLFCWISIAKGYKLKGI